MVTRFLGQRINYERPLGQVVALFRHEVTGPRRRTAAAGGAVRSEPRARRSGVAAPARTARAASAARPGGRSAGRETAPSTASGRRRWPAAASGAANDRDEARCHEVTRAETGAAERAGRRRGRALAGEAGLPKYAPDIALRSIDGHLTRTGTQVMAWYRLAAQAWSFRSDSQREVLIRQIAAQLGELQGRWLHLRVTTRPYPVHMWAESFDNNALGRMPDVAGALGWDGFLEGEQRHLMGLSMSDKEVFLGIEVSGRSMLDRWVDARRPGAGQARARRGARRARRAGLRGRPPRRAGRRQPASTPCPASRRRHRVADAPLVRAGPARAAHALGGAGRRSHRWETEDLAAFTDGVEHAPGALRAHGAGGRAGCARRRSRATSPCSRSG